MTGTPTIADLIAAAEPGPAELGGLIERLEAEHRLRGARDGGRPIGAAGLTGVRVTGVRHDSRHVRPGDLFVAVPGLTVDGHDYVPRAAGAGAAAVIVERPLPAVPLPQVVVAEARAALATAAAWWYGDPSRELRVLGITGTDGKTTTSFLALAALEAAGTSCGLIGTIETKIGDVREAHAEHATTPEAPDLQAALRAMVGARNDTAILETTSHGLALRRVDAVAYDAAILTNLTHEHLELHGTWEAYRDAKLSLFERLHRGDLAVVNADDPSAGLFAGVAQEAGARVVTYGTDDQADVRAAGVEDDGTALRVRYTAPSGDGRLALRLAGRFNVHNALAVVALGEGWGLDPAAVRRGLESVDGVPGRMERIEAGQPFGVVVDFAHSPASLEKVLELLAPVAAARGGGLIAVFGSAGERDVGKRALMGRVAGQRARLVVATDEDPRGEDREVILEEIARGAEAAGMRRERDLLIVPDRREAIGAAFERARPGDVVLLAGKGHERSIIGPDGPTPWNEREAAMDALARLGYPEPGAR
jgi:UDP-N-acetylmuramoyl-L-alanyl-D-glutamate--2,6-diaminopimelate ligase